MPLSFIEASIASADSSSFIWYSPSCCPGAFMRRSGSPVYPDELDFDQTLIQLVGRSLAGPWRAVRLAA